MRAFKDPSTKKESESLPIPNALVYEWIKGAPIYYHGYKDYLSGDKTMEELMGSGYLQVFLIMAIIKRLLAELPDAYQVFTNEIGIILKKGDRRSIDIAIYRKDALENVPLENKYLQVPPEVAIEIDTKADLENFTTAMDYVYEKTDDLLAFGVRKVIWIFTSSRKVLVAGGGEKWVTTGWDEPVQVIGTIQLNLKNMVQEG